MARLTSPQREKFARLYVRYGNASRAYRGAYNVREDTLPTTIWSAASTILADSKVSKRVDELAEQAAKRAVVNAAGLVTELEQARSLALELELPSAAVSATMGKARITGHLKAPEGNAVGNVSTGININITIEPADAGLL